MRAICDSCETAVAVFFCPADEAALCDSCNKKDHQLEALNGCDCQLPVCDKLVCYHTRLPLVDPGNFLRCELCDREPGCHVSLLEMRYACSQCATQKNACKFTGAPLLDLPPPETEVIEAEENGGEQNQPPVKPKAEVNKQKNLRLLHLPVVKAKRSGRISGCATVLGIKLIDVNRKPRQSAASKNKK